MIHGDNPFSDSPDQRDPVRQFRGRLTAPVTIVTAGSTDNRTGLTVSSLLVVEGDPGSVQLVVGPTSDLWDAVAPQGRFLVHICHIADRALAEVFAGLRPNPGGPFAGLDTYDSDHGPVLERLPNRAYCTSIERVEFGYSGLVTGRIDRIETTTLTDPLVYFRGGYRSID